MSNKKVSLSIGGVFTAAAVLIAGFLVPASANSTPNSYTVKGESWIDVPAADRVYFEDFNEGDQDDTSIYHIPEGVSCTINGVTANGPFLAGDDNTEPIDVIGDDDVCTQGGVAYDPIDDSSRLGAHPIGFEINFFGETYEDLYFTENGMVSFEEPSDDYDESLTEFVVDSEQSLIVPFGIDLQYDAARGSFYTAQTTVDDKPAFVISWMNMEHYDDDADNSAYSFQLVLIDDGDGDFTAFFNFDEVKVDESGYFLQLDVDMRNGVTVGSNIVTAKFVSGVTNGVCLSVETFANGDFSDETDATWGDNAKYVKLHNESLRQVSVWQDSACQTPNNVSAKQDIANDGFLYYDIGIDSETYAVAVGWGTFDSSDQSTDVTEFFPNEDFSTLVDDGSNELINRSVNTSVKGRMVISQVNGVTTVVDQNDNEEDEPSETTVTISNGVCELNGSGTSSDKYLVSSKLDLYEIEEDCISGSGSIYFKQTQNIDLGGIHHNDIDSTDAHIIYDGDGFTISGLANLKNSSEHGLFGDVEDLTVSNLNLVATVIMGDIYDVAEVGTLVGQVDNDLTVTNVNVLVGSFSAGSESGGLAGEVQGDAVITDTSVYVYNMIFMDDEMALMIGEVDGSSTFTRVSAVAVNHQFPSDKTETWKDLGIGGLVGDADSFNVDQAFVDFGNPNPAMADPRSYSVVGGIIGDSETSSSDGSYIRNSEVLIDVQGVADFGGLVGKYVTDTTGSTNLEISNVVINATALQAVRPEITESFYMGGLIGDIAPSDGPITVDVDSAVVSAQFKDNLPEYVVNWFDSSITGGVLSIDSNHPGLSVGDTIRISGMTDGEETEADSGSAAIINGEHTVTDVNGQFDFEIDLSGTGITDDAQLGDGDATYTVVSDTTITANSMIGDSDSTSFNFTDTYHNTTEWDKTEFPSLEATITKFSSTGITDRTATQMQTKSNFAFEAEIGDAGDDYQESTFEMCSTGIHIAFTPGPCADPELRTFSTVASSYEVGKAITPITVTNTENGRDDVLLYEVEPSLPAGLAIDRATGKISGTPREATPSTRYEIRTKTTGSRYNENLDGHNDSSITFSTFLPTLETSDIPDPEVIRDTVVIEREVPAPYTGALLTEISSKLVNRCQSTEMSMLGQDLEKLKKLYFGSTELSFEINNSRLVFTMPCVDAGEYSLKLESDGGTLEYKKLFNLVDVATGESSVVQDFTADQVVNAGSFKGYVAVYAKGYEGKKLSAKIGNDWVIVDSLESDFERITDFTGAGYAINVRVFIDGVLTREVPITTK